MVIYRETISGGDGVESQRLNLEIPFALLNKARSANEPFVLVSRADVFDLGQYRHYHEWSSRNGDAVSGKILSVMEDYVLNYDRGIVIRVHCLFSEISERLSATAISGEEAFLDDTYPVADQVLNHVANLAAEIVGDRSMRVIHIPISAESVPLMIFKLRDGGDVEVCDDHGENGILKSNNFITQFGITELASCEYANRYYIQMAIEQLKRSIDDYTS